MLGIITLPFRLLRAGRFGLIALGALITGLGLWLQINTVPEMLAPAIAAVQGGLSVVIDPQSTIFGMFSKVGGVLGLMGLLGMTLHDIAPAKSRDDRADDDAPISVPEPVYSSTAQSTWQERLAAKTSSAQTVRAEPKPARSFGSILRLIVVGLVICAFLAVLGAAIIGNVTQGSANTATLSPAQAMIQAQFAAHGAATQPATALPSFNLPAFDAASTVVWFKDHLARALAGDQDAMITLGSILGGLFVLMLGIKIIFGLRRSKARRQVDIRQMGFN